MILVLRLPSVPRAMASLYHGWATKPITAVLVAEIKANPAAMHWLSQLRDISFYNTFQKSNKKRLDKVLSELGLPMLNAGCILATARSYILTIAQTLDYGTSPFQNFICVCAVFLGDHVVDACVSRCFQKT